MGAQRAPAVQKLGEGRWQVVRDGRVIGQLLRIGLDQFETRPALGSATVKPSKGAAIRHLFQIDSRGP